MPSRRLYAPVYLKPKIIRPELTAMRQWRRMEVSRPGTFEQAPFLMGIWNRSICEGKYAAGQDPEPTLALQAMKLFEKNIFLR